MLADLDLLVEQVHLHEVVVLARVDRLVVPNQRLGQLLRVQERVGTLPGKVHEDVKQPKLCEHRLVCPDCGNPPLEGILLWVVLG